MTALPVAILGAGLMGRWHAHSARKAGAEIVGVADPELARAEAVARGGAVFGSLEALLDGAAPAVLHVCSPTASHGPAIETALSRGVHVFAEKPLAANAGETRRLCDRAAEAGLLVCPVHQYAFQGAVERIRGGLARAGAPTLVEMRFHSAGAVGAEAGALPGIAADILPHPVSLAQRLWPGALPAPEAWAVTPMGPGGWQLTAPLGGALLRVELSLTARPTEASLAVRGDGGAWEADLFHGFARFRGGTATRATKTLRPLADGAGLFAMAAGNLGLRALRREPAYPGLVSLTRAFYAAAASAAPCPISAEEAVEAAAIRDMFLGRAA